MHVKYDVDQNLCLVQTNLHPEIDNNFVSVIIFKFALVNTFVLCSQVVTFLHTVLLSKNLNFKTALVVCPLNTVLNWISEFKKWQSNMGLDTVKVWKSNSDLLSKN